jgi:hypothetical protein
MKTLNRYLTWLALALTTAGALAQTPAPPPPPAPPQPQRPAQPPTPEGRLYAPGAFDRLEVDGSALIKLTQGARDQIFISGDSNVRDSVEVSLANKRLRISSAGSWKFWNSGRLQIDVQMREVSRLSLSGTGDLYAPGPIKSEQLAISISGSGVARFDDLHVDQLRFDISGAGDGQLVGKVDELKLNISGKGKLLADQLRAENAVVSISGVGNAILWVTDSLRVSISGVGTVDYWGQPDVKRSTSGLGSVNSRGEKQ